MKTASTLDIAIGGSFSHSYSDILVLTPKGSFHEKRQQIAKIFYSEVKKNLKEE